MIYVCCHFRTLFLFVLMFLSLADSEADKCALSAEPPIVAVFEHSVDNHTQEQSGDKKTQEEDTCNDSQSIFF